MSFVFIAMKLIGQTASFVPECFYYIFNPSILQIKPTVNAT